MNWSTRLRRWVRIRMPPVREASTKPTAATVLPAPVACSNQKRRLAPGSSGLLDDVLVLVARPVLGLLLLGGLLLVLLEILLVDLGPCSVAGGLVLGGGRRRRAAVPVAGPRVSVEPLLDVGDQRGERARERVDLMSGELGAVGKMRLLLGEQPLEAEQQREVAAPLDRGGLVPSLDLGERGVQRPAPRRARGEVARASRPRAGTALARTRARVRCRRCSAPVPLCRPAWWSQPSEAL